METIIKFEEFKKNFYNNPSHWSNNKRKMFGMNVIRKPINNKERTKFPYREYLNQEIFEDLVNEIEKRIEIYFQSDKFTNFAEIKNVPYGDKK